MSALKVFPVALICLCLGGCPAPSVPGGYTDVSVSDDKVVAAAQLAVAEQAEASGTPVKLVGIQSAEQQVVAGFNYKMELQVEEGGKPRRATAVVHDGWNDEGGDVLKLVSWTWK